MTIDDGYAIQRAWLKLKLAEGRVVKGRKIGLTSRAMQQSSQIDEPDYAPLLDDMFFAAGGDIPVDRFIAPRVEVELAFILGRPLQGPGVTLFDVLAATELRDAGDRDHRRAHRAVRPRDEGAAQGVRHHRRLRRQRRHRHSAAGRCGRDDVDLRWVGAMLYKNGVIEETGLAAGVLNHPANGVAWLANKIAPYDEQLERRRRRARRLVHAADAGARAATTSTSTTARSARSPSASSDTRSPTPMKQPNNAFKAALARREAQIGLWLGLADAYVAEMLRPPASTGC